MGQPIYKPKRMCMLFWQALMYCKGSIYLYDTETTGANPKEDEIVQISILALRRGKTGQYQIADKLDEYVKPSRPVSAGASAVNHITNEFLADKATSAEIVKKVVAFMPDLKQSVVMGYCNTQFDDKLIKRLYDDHGYEFHPLVSIDVKRMAEELVSRKDVPDQKLTLKNVSGMYGIAEPEGLHNSMVDIYVTGDLAFRLYDDYVRHHIKESSVYAARNPITITGMYHFRKSKTVDYVYLTGTVKDRNGYVHAGRIRYSIWEKQYEEIEGDLFQYGNLDDFDIKANKQAGGDLCRYR